MDRVFVKAHTQIECDLRVWQQTESLYTVRPAPTTMSDVPSCGVGRAPSPAVLRIQAPDADPGRLPRAELVGTCPEPRAKSAPWKSGAYAPPRQTGHARQQPQGNHGAFRRGCLAAEPARPGMVGDPSPGTLRRRVVGKRDQTGTRSPRSARNSSSGSSCRRSLPATAAGARLLPLPSRACSALLEFGFARKDVAECHVLAGTCGGIVVLLGTSLRLGVRPIGNAVGQHLTGR